MRKAKDRVTSPAYLVPTEGGSCVVKGMAFYVVAHFFVFYVDYGRLVEEMGE